MIMIRLQLSATTCELCHIALKSEVCVVYHDKADLNLFYSDRNYHKEITSQTYLTPNDQQQTNDNLQKRMPTVLNLSNCNLYHVN